MRVGIMQPYFVPYIGYWQLMNAVDKYVIYDDVNYIKGGWINRNRILENGSVRYFNIPTLGASPNKLINDVKVCNDLPLINKNLRIVNNCYRKAPFFSEVYPMVEKILNFKEDNIAKYIEHSFKIICEYLNIKTELIVSSSLCKNGSLKGQEKVLDICRLLGATEYYNAIGGRLLYSHNVFESQNISLKFLHTRDIVYAQFGNGFEKNLSIIDVMMFNSSEKIQQMLMEYDLED